MILKTPNACCFEYVTHTHILFYFAYTLGKHLTNITNTCTAIE